MDIHWANGWTHAIFAQNMGHLSVQLKGTRRAWVRPHCQNPQNSARHSAKHAGLSSAVFSVVALECAEVREWFTMITMCKT